MLAKPDGTPPTAEVRPSRVLGALADAPQLCALAAVVLAPEPVGAADVSDAAGVGLKRVERALESLEAAGVIRASAAPSSQDPVGAPPATGRRPALDERRWEAVPSAFGVAARLVAHMRPEVDAEALGATPEQVPILRGFLAGGRLTGLPAQESKRAVVLDFAVQRFEPGRRYGEAEVNRVLNRLWDDHATLRRSLVDEGLLERRDGHYWRSGGTFDVDGDLT